MKRIPVKAIACAATLLAASAISCTKANSTPETYSYNKSGIALVRIGADCIDIPSSYPGLYSRGEYLVSYSGEVDEGVDILYYDDNSDDFIIRAILNVDQATIDTMYEEDMVDNSYPLGDTRIEDLLKNTGSTTITAICVAPSPHITVNIDGHEIATDESAVKFMEMPGAVTTVSIGEGICLSCTIGELNMFLMNAYDAITPEAYNRIGEKLAAAIETGVFEPVTVSPSEIDPAVRFDYFSY